MSDHNSLLTFSLKLLDALANSNRGLQGLVDIGYSVLENPIMITDKNWRAIALTMVEIPDDTGWNELLINGLLSPELVSAGIRENLVDRIEQSEGPFKCQYSSMKYSRLFNKVVINGKSVATVSVIEYNRPFKDIDFSLVKILSDSIATEMQKDQFQQFTRGMQFEQLIENLLERRLKDPKVIEERVNLLNIGIKKNIYVFVFDVSEFDSKKFSLSYMRDTLEKMISGGKALIYDNKIVITASFSRTQDILKTELINLSAFLKKNNIRCGISRRCTQLAELRFYYDQALDALRVGTYMDRERYIYPYGEYAVYHIAEACSEAGGSKVFSHPALEVLMAYDKEYNTTFTNSLYEYLIHFKNISNTAKALHLHRNTLIYHLQRIEEIMEVSLSDYHTIQLLELSFRLLEYDKKITPRFFWNTINNEKENNKKD